MIAEDQSINAECNKTGTLALKFLSNLVSIILIPLLIPTYLFFIILFYFPQTIDSISLTYKLFMLAGVFLSTILLPFLFVFILFKLNIISNLTLNKREDRLLPQVFSCVCYLLVSFFLISKLGISNSLSLVMIANTLSLFAITIVTNFWKISTHTSGAMGLLSIAFILYLKYPSQNFLLPFLIILFLTLSVCIARLYLKVHTLKQVIGGCFLGAIIGVSVFYFLD